MAKTVNYEFKIMEALRNNGFIYVDPFNDDEMLAVDNLVLKRLVITKFCGISLMVISYKEEL